jgi:glycerol-3-phosphate dehydrogenase (NAD(P)+)
MKDKKIQIIGAGSWGCALAKIFSESGYFVNLKTRTTSKTKETSQNLENYKITISNDYTYSGDYNIFVVDSENLISCIEEFNDFTNPVIIATKGMNHHKYCLYSTYFKDFLDNIYFLSGPNFANQVSGAENSACILASRNFDGAKEISANLANKKLSIHPSSDFIGVQISGIYKNICAIYFGYLSQTSATDNYKAKILTDCLNEMAYIIEKLEGDKSSALLYSGVGDLVLSCYSPVSRNYKLGYAIASKELDFLDKFLAEGINSAKSLKILCKDFYKELGILNKVINLIEENGL